MAAFAIEPVLAGYVVLLTFCWLAVGARVYIRRYVVKSLDVGDWLMILTLFCFTVMWSMSILSLSHGGGNHMALVSADDLLQIGKFFYIKTVIYGFATVTLKLSIACLLLRLAITPRPRLIIKVVALSYTIYGVCFVFTCAFQCIPVSLFWTNFAEGNCISRPVIVAFTYSHAGVSLVTDGFFALLPIWFISGIQLSRRTKIGVSLVLGLGLSTAVVNVARFFYIGAFRSNEDITFTVYPISVTSDLEIGIGIMAASLATLRPFLRSISRALGYSGSSSSAAASVAQSRAEDLTRCGTVTQIASSPAANYYHDHLFSKEIHVNDIDPLTCNQDLEKGIPQQVDTIVFPSQSYLPVTCGVDDSAGGKQAPNGPGVRVQVRWTSSSSMSTLDGQK